MCSRESAAKATNIKSASQLPIEYCCAVALVENYPPPADMEVDEAEFAELRAELKSGGKVHGKEQIKALSAMSSAYCTLPMQRIGRSYSM